MSSFKNIVDDLVKGMIHGMEGAIEEHPEESKGWTAEQLFEKGANWAERHVLISEAKEDKDANL